MLNWAAGLSRRHIRRGAPVRWPDNLVARVLTTADTLSARAKLLATDLERRMRLPSCDQPLSGWETQQERREEDAWRLHVGMEHSQPPRMAAPNDFTSRVMARIETIEAHPLPPSALPTYAVPPISSTLGPVPVVAGTIGIAAMMALISSCLLAILAPAQAVALLGAALSAGAVLLTLVRAALGVTSSAASGAGVILLLAIVPLVTLVAA